MKRPPPPAIALVAAVAQRAVAGPARPSGVRTATAVLLTAGSASLAVSAALRFRRSGTTVEPFRPELASVLVTTGANALTRNPMYVGMAGVLLAHATWRGSWAALVPLAGFVAVIDRTQIPAEETALRVTFGEAYEAYRAGTPRWLDRRSLPAG